jgi:hypothetical protein
MLTGTRAARVDRDGFHLGVPPTALPTGPPARAEVTVRVTDLYLHPVTFLAVS